MTRRLQRAELGALGAVLAALLACGGANENQKGVGDEPGGVKVGLGDIAVAPIGDYVLFKRSEELAVGWLESGAIDGLPVAKPSRLAFSKLRPVVYVGSEASQQVVAVEVPLRSAKWATATRDASVVGMRLMSSQDDRFVVVAHDFHVDVLLADTGAKGPSFTFEDKLVDVVILPDSKRALAVETHSFDGDTPTTRVSVLDLETAERRIVSVPNCSDRIAIASEGSHALLAPTTCHKDPVSVIDLTVGQESFERNLPGFGPVAVSPDGTTAVAFLDRDAIELELFDDPAQAPVSAVERFHLMLIDTVSLKYEFAALGDSLPRYALTPDGNVLLVDSPLKGDATRLFDVASRTFRSIEGPEILLNNFTMSSDSGHVYALMPKLHDIDIQAGKASVIDPGFVPSNLNISADDKKLFLRKSASEICVFDLQTRSCSRTFVLKK